MSRTPPDGAVDAPCRRHLDLVHGLEIRDRGLHRLGRLQHERQLHLAGAEQLADHLHAGEQMDVDDVERRVLLERLVEVGLEPLTIAVDDRLQALLTAAGRSLPAGPPCARRTRRARQRS
jgi:hypothetical protein